MKEKVVFFINKIKNANRFVKLICFGAVTLVIITLSLALSGVTIAYDVHYGDGVIGQIYSKSIFNKAKSIAADSICTDNAEEYFYEPTYSYTVALSEKLSGEQALAEKIIEVTAEISEHTAVKVDGEIVAIGDNDEEVNALVEARLNAYNVSDCENSSQFTDNVVVEEVFCHQSEVMEEDSIAEVLNTLSVSTKVNVSEKSVIKYVTVTKQNEEKHVGYYNILTEGSNGVLSTDTVITYVNGVETERTAGTQTVVVEPVNEVVEIGVGSKRVPCAAPNGSLMDFPVQKADGWYISNYFKGSGHKGIDIAVDKGTPIYAALDGTVEVAQYRSDYGYYIIINHGDGIKTLYAHCNKLFVTAGQTVIQGQTIAEVGRTGYSTGNHLHFSVMKNDAFVNPMDYIRN